MTTALEPDLSSQAFVLWACEQLGWRCAREESIYRVAPGEGSSEDASDGTWAFTFDPLVAEQRRAEGVELATAGAPAWERIVAALRAEGDAVQARPARCPQSVHEISDRLFSAYSVEGGSVHLAGCRLEDRPCLRLTYRTAEASAASPVRHFFVTPEGEELPDALRQALRLDELTAWRERPPRLPLGELQRWIAASESLATESSATTDEPLVRTVVWSKYTEGKLHFTCGEASAELPFAGWAALLKPPPFVCPHSGRATYHLAATDDGRLCAAEEIEACGESGRRVLRSELVACSETGRRVLPEFAAACPVSGQFVLRDLLETCPCCRQQVSPAVIDHGVCRACRELRPVDKDDPRMARLLSEYPALDRWRRWKLSETDAAYVSQATSLFKRLLVVVDKQTLAPLHLAEASRVLPNWTELSPAQREEALR